MQRGFHKSRCNAGFIDFLRFTQDLQRIVSEMLSVRAPRKSDIGEMVSAALVIIASVYAAVVFFQWLFTD
jgi:hypothetical protein